MAADGGGSDTEMNETEIAKYTTAAKATVSLMKVMVKNIDEKEDIKNEYVNFYVNSYLLYHGVFPVCRHILFLVSQDKKSHEKFLNYLKRKHRDKVKRFNAEEKGMMEKNSSDNFTLSLIYKLVPIFSKTLKKINSKEQGENFQKLWNTNLEQAKNIINNLNHPPSLQVTQTLERTIADLLNRTKELLDLEQSSIETELRMVNNKLEWLKKLTLNDVRTVLFIICQARNKTRFQIQLRKDCSRCEKIYLPTGSEAEFDRDTIFFKVTLEDEDEAFSCEDLFDRTNKKFIILRGRPGQGKTTLLRMIADHWCGRNESTELEFKNLMKFDMVIPVECRGHNYTTLVNLIKATYPSTFVQFNDRQIEHSIAELMTLFLVDGYDESNESSKSIVKEVIRCKGPNVTVLVSAREKAGDDIEKDFTDWKLNFEIFKIAAIDTPELKEKYLERYTKEISDINYTEFMETFNNLPPEATESLNNPILLTMFVQLYRERKESLMHWLTEFDLFETVLDIIHCKIKDTITKSGIMDAELSAKRILDAVGELSLELHYQHMLYVSEERFKKFVNTCRTNICATIDYSCVLSCILSPEFLSHSLCRTYTFYHLTLQEMLAARTLAKTLSEGNFISHCQDEKYSLEGIVKGIIDSSGTTCLNISRYGNILKYVVLLLCAQHKIDACNEFLIEIFCKYDPSFEYCTDICLASGSNSAVIRLMSMTLVAKNWRVNSTRQYQITNKFLSDKQPVNMIVSIMSQLNPDQAEETSNFLLNIGKIFKGRLTLKLHHSHKNLIPVDDIVLKLWSIYNLRNGLKLVNIKACLKTDSAITVIKSLLCTGAALSLSCDSYEHNFHLLEGIGGSNRDFIVKHSECSESSVKQLPTGFKSHPPALFIRDISAGAKDIVLKMIRCLAPKNKQFSSLFLLHCELTPEDIEDMADRMQKNEFRTTDKKYSGEKFRNEFTSVKCCTTADGKCAAPKCHLIHDPEKNSKCWRLVLTDKICDRKRLVQRLKRKIEKVST